MRNIVCKIRRLTKGGAVWVLTAVLCVITALTVSHMVTAQMQKSYDSLYAPSDPPGSQRTLLAFAGELGELEDKLDAITVDLKVDGERSMVRVSGTTVADALVSAGVTLGPDDMVEPSPDTELERYQDIIVTRRERVLYTKEVDLPYRTVYVYSPAVKPGDEEVDADGQNGVAEETYAQLVSKGGVVEEKLVSSATIQEPVNRRVLMGFRVKPISPLDFYSDFDENGEPIDYTQVLRGQRAAGYSAGAGAGTASGLPAQVGHVAVNPAVIPYGTKLYIQSPDGAFIYGYAVAADTGSALVQGRIGVDLFYDSYTASVNNGIREVDIFLLP